MDDQENLLIPSVPQTFDEIDKMIESQPLGWEHLVYAGLLQLKMAELEGKYRDYLLGMAPYSQESYNAEQAMPVLISAFDPWISLINNFDLLFTEKAMTLAFGPPGEHGDAEMIKHLTQRYVDIYEGFLDHATFIRGLKFPERFREVQLATADLGSEAINGMRKFVVDCVDQMNRLNEILNNRKPGDPPTELELVAKISMDPELMKRLEAAIAKAAKNS